MRAFPGVRVLGTVAREDLRWERLSRGDCSSDPVMPQITKTEMS